MYLPFQTTHIYYHNLTIRFYPEKDIRENAWIGSVFRNGFLYAAKEVENLQGLSLYDILSQFPLPETHPYYKQLCGGFPKGFVWDLSEIPHSYKDFTLERGRIYTATLRLIGHLSKYTMPCCMAIERFCKRGFGHPFVPLHLMDIHETNDVKNLLLYNDSLGYLTDMPELPCHMETLANKNTLTTVKLHTLSPVCLIKFRNTETDNGYQEKLNGFPSLYQWIRTSAYRLYYLNMLYVKDFPPIELSILNASIEKYLHMTYNANLLRADLCYCKLYSTPKKEKKGQVYSMDGYEGSMIFNNVSTDYLPLLRFMSRLGVGNDINYGLGFYKVIEKNHL